MSSPSFVAADIPPARVGQPLNEVDTPACLVDLDALERNIKTAVAMIQKHAPTVKIRPHFKSHKCVQIAALQIKLGHGLTSGFCCQKVVEAEALISAGLNDVLVSNQIVGATKIQRLVSLAAANNANKIAVLIDDDTNAREISAAAAAAGATITALVEVDVGQRRCGVMSTQAAVRLAMLINHLPGLKFGGIQCYHGKAQHIRSHTSRRETINEVATKAAECRDAIVAAGVPCDTVTGGGTGTFMFEATSGVFTEVQPGSYILHDCDYARNEDAEGQQTWTTLWRPSLFLLSTVMSRHAPRRHGHGHSHSGGFDAGTPGATPSTTPTPVGLATGLYSPSPVTPSPVASEGYTSPSEPGRCVIDSGLKAQSVDSGPPTVVCSEAEYKGLAAATDGLLYDNDALTFLSTYGHLQVSGVSDEHTTLVPRASGLIPPLGTKLMLMPGHCDPTVNIHDWIVAFRGHTVEGVWRLTARSPGV